MTLKRTNIFGIHGFLYGTPPGTTATAPMKPTVLLKFEMSSCKKVIESLAPLGRALSDRAKELSLRYLRPSKLFRSVSDSSLDVLSNLFNIESKRAGEIILDVSDENNRTFSVLVAGSALELHEDLKRPGGSDDHQSNQHDKLRASDVGSVMSSC